MKTAGKVKVAFISYVTKSSHLNYGATLHGYAFQYVLDKLGCESVAIDYLPIPVSRDNLKYPILSKEQGRTPIVWIAVKVNYLISFFSNLTKYYKFEHFIERYIKITKRSFDYNELETCKSLDENPEVFVCESDVIWKYLEGPNYDKHFYLDFPAAIGKKKVAYAPSISTGEFSIKQKALLKKLTDDFAAISSREEEGASYLSKILGRKVEWVLDPTLLLDEDDYLDITIKPKEENYLLIYNCTENDREMVKMACAYAKTHNLKVIEISNYAINGLSPWHTVKCNVGIEEWLGYIKHSTAFFTNSFHGLCFAVIFKKDIILFQRNKSDYKMPNLIAKLAMGNIFVKVENRVLPSKVQIDYSEVYNRLNAYREKSIEYITRNII